MKNGSKRALKIAIKTVLITVISFAFIALLFGGTEFYRFMYNGLTAPRPPKPKIRYGEFPFTLVYELNGKEIVIEDVLICKYDGVGYVGDFVFAHNKWKQSFKSGNRWVVLLEIDETTVIHYPTRDSASYYMGEGGGREISFSVDAAIADPNTHDVYTDRVCAEELLSEYGIRILSWEIALPITNTFR